MTQPTILTSIVFSLGIFLTSALNAQQSCVDLGDPAGNFVPRGFCLPVDPGNIGEAADITLENATMNVVADPDGRFDLIVPLAHSITAPLASSTRPLCNGPNHPFFDRVYAFANWV